jgi:putative Mn2+ efflux pump MntP
MVSYVAVAVLLSLDSFVASFGLGACGKGHRQRNRLAVAFGICDGTATLIGMTLGAAIGSRLAPYADWIAPLFVGCYAIVVLVMTRLGNSVAGANPTRDLRILYSIPLVMGLDNLAEAATLGSSVSAPVCAAGMVVASGLLSLFGFRAGELTGTRLYRMMESRTVGRYLGGLALLIASFTLAII